MTNDEYKKEYTAQYKQCYLMSKDKFNSWFKTCWLSTKVAWVGKEVKITSDNRTWTILEVYPEIRTLDQIENIPNQLKDYNSYRKRDWDENLYDPKTGK